MGDFEVDCFGAVFVGVAFAGLRLWEWLRAFGVIKNKRSKGKSNNRAERLFMMEKSLQCPMP